MSSSSLSDVRRALLPAGKLRAAINYGNIVLAQKDAVTGAPGGVSVALARELARRLGVELEILGFDAAGKVFAETDNNTWDIGFLAIDPVRGQKVLFTAPYVLIEGTYLVNRNSPLRSIDDIDAEGVRVAVGKGAAYDLFLTRELKKAEIVRADTSAAAIDLFLEKNLDAAAGVRQPLEKAAEGNARLKVLPGSFTSIRQAMVTPKKNQIALDYLHAFIEEMKASGFVERELKTSGQDSAGIAPPENQAPQPV
ncbi:MAG TPA: ABC transporter substrate-binding protein [Paralcaligenes sp.]